MCKYVSCNIFQWNCDENFSETAPICTFNSRFIFFWIFEISCFQNTFKLSTHFKGQVMLPAYCCQDLLLDSDEGEVCGDFCKLIVAATSDQEDPHWSRNREVCRWWGSGGKMSNVDAENAPCTPGWKGAKKIVITSGGIFDTFSNPSDRIKR